MNSSLLQAYTDYLTNVNKMAYDSALSYVKTTQEFVAEAHKLNPYKDVFGIMDSFVANSSQKSK